MATYKFPFEEMHIYPDDVWYIYHGKLSDIYGYWKKVDISNTESGGKLALRVIHSKSGTPGSPEFANNFDFPQKFCPRT